MKSRRIYYVPGMISLIFLPILCVWYLEKNKKIERCLEVYACSRYLPENHKKNIWCLDTTVLTQPRMKRKYAVIRVDIHSTESDIIKRITKISDDLVLDKDTVNGIHVILNDNCPYRYLPEIIDLFKKYYKLVTTTEENNAFRNNIELYSGQYFLYENNIWFLNYKYPKLMKEVWECKVQSLRCVINTPDQKQTFFELICIKTKILMKYWYIFLVTILFSIVSVQQTFKYYIKSNNIKQNN